MPDMCCGRCAYIMKSVYFTLFLDSLESGKFRNQSRMQQWQAPYVDMYIDRIGWRDSVADEYAHICV